MTADVEGVTRLLKAWSAGDKSALDELIPLVYAQLRGLAARFLAAERPGHTLRPTALVHEAYLRLADSNLAFKDRLHFYAVSARLLRHILVDHAKSQRRKKRGGGAQRVSLEQALGATAETPVSILELDEALERLTAQDKRKSEIVEVVFFGGLTNQEAAELFGISPATVQRELRMAKAWLHRELTGAEH
jgi:RNA polymerase sigma factor (TIGR02999 family)